MERSLFLFPFIACGSFIATLFSVVVGGCGGRRERERLRERERIPAIDPRMTRAAMREKELIINQEVVITGSIK